METPVSRGDDTAKSTTAAPFDDEDVYFGDLIASLPDSVDLPDLPVAQSRYQEPREEWKPRHSLESAIELLSPEIRETLSARLGGAFREVRKYRPSRSLELMQSAGAKTVGNEEATPAMEEDGDSED